MLKRKRGADDSDRPKSSAKQQRIDHKIAQGSIHLAHAYKVAKSFERQKLGRREKTARSEKNDKDTVRIESEIAALKTLDTSACAHLFLHKTLSKIKAVAASDLFVVYLEAPPAPLQDVASQNIYARLCNSKPVKEALAKLLEDLLDAAHIHAPKKEGKGKQKAEPGQKKQGSPEIKSEPKSGAIASSREGSGIDEEDSEADFADLDHRVANSDDDSDEEMDDGEFDDLSKLESQLRAEGVRDRDDWSGSDDELDDMDHPDPDLEDDLDEGESDDLAPAKRLDSKSKPKSTKAASISKPTSSVLLPSLTMGGYISGSDGSEAEDLDEKPRKNRPGQRARQAIWEKKYGAGAKHLQDTGKSRDKGWDAKRGATSGGATRGGRFSRDSVRRFDGDVATVPSKKPKKDDTGKLHPSWEAAKVAKEKKAAAAATFTGKKISFD